jgi:hypothetical protein
MVASRFKDMVQRRFGAQAMEHGWFYEASGTTVMKAVDAGEVRYPEHFEHAYVRPKGWNSEIDLVRSGSNWKVAASNFLKKGEIDPDVVRVVDALQKTADELEKGRYETIRDARDAMRLRIWERREPAPEKVRSASTLAQ